MQVFFYFVRNKLWWAQPVDFLIKLISKTNFSHCEVGVCMGQGQLTAAVCYGAEYPVSRVISYNQWLNTYQIMHQFTIYESDLARISAMDAWLKAKLNKKYNVLDLFMVAFNTLSGGLLAKYMKGRVYGLICSELVGEFMINFYGIDFHKDNALIGLPDVLAQAEKICGK